MDGGWGGAVVGGYGCVCVSVFVCASIQIPSSVCLFFFLRGILLMSTFCEEWEVRMNVFIFGGLFFYQFI
jgi:hypothetical protein